MNMHTLALAQLYRECGKHCNSLQFAFSLLSYLRSAHQLVYLGHQMLKQPLQGGERQFRPHRSQPRSRRHKPTIAVGVIARCSNPAVRSHSGLTAGVRGVPADSSFTGVAVVRRSRWARQWWRAFAVFSLRRGAHEVSARRRHVRGLAVHVVAVDITGSSSGSSCTSTSTPALRLGSALLGDFSLGPGLRQGESRELFEALPAPHHCVHQVRIARVLVLHLWCVSSTVTKFKGNGNTVSCQDSQLPCARI